MKAPSSELSSSPLLPIDTLQIILMLVVKFLLEMLWLSC